jgi:broad specificity phosphatase PhoE
MTRTVELRRHTANDGDALTPAGVAAALALSGSILGGYALIVSSGAQRATQTAACLLAGCGERVAGGVVVEPGLRSQVEARWRAAYKKAGAGDLASLRDADPDLVRADAVALGAGLRRVFDRLEEGQRALAIGHSPTNEAGVFGLTGVIVEPMAKGGGVIITQDGEAYSVEAADR